MRNMKYSCASLLIFLSSICLAQDLNSFKINKLISNSAVEINLDYTADILSNVHGGLEKKSFYLDNINVILKADLEKLLNWRGAALNFNVLGNSGGVPSEATGAVQGISNIAAYDTWKVYEFWIEQEVTENLSVLFGLYDLNSEFDTRESSSIFINPSQGIGPEYAMTGENGPSIFPTTSLAFRIKYLPSENTYIQAALFDGIPGDVSKPEGTQIKLNKEDGLLLSLEGGLISEAETFSEDYYKLSVGGWYYTKEFEQLHIDIGHYHVHSKSGNFGIYLSGEKNLYTENSENNQGLTAFARIGYADPDINQIDYYIGAGFTYIGLIPGRDEDIFGLAFASAHNNDLYIKKILTEGEMVNEKKLETIIELTYDFRINDLLRFQPDIQYTINPTFCHKSDKSFTIGARIKMTL